MFRIISKQGSYLKVSEDLLNLSSSWNALLRSGMQETIKKEIETDLTNNDLEELIYLMELIIDQFFEELDKSLQKKSLIDLYQLRIIADKYLINELSNRIDKAILSKLQPKDYYTIRGYNIDSYLPDSYDYIVGDKLFASKQDALDYLFKYLEKENFNLVRYDLDRDQDVGDQVSHLAKKYIDDFNNHIKSFLFPERYEELYINNGIEFLFENITREELKLYTIEHIKRWFLQDEPVVVTTKHGDFHTFRLKTLKF